MEHRLARRRCHGTSGCSPERPWSTSVGVLSRGSGYWLPDRVRRDLPANTAGRVTHRRGLWRSLVSASVWGTEGREFKSPQPDKQIPCLKAFGRTGPGRPSSRGLSGPSNPLKCPYRPDSAWEAGAQVCRRACHKGSRADFPSFWRSLFQDARPCGRRRGRRLPEWDPGPSRTARSSPIRTASTRGDQTRVSSRRQSLSHLRP